MTTVLACVDGSTYDTSVCDHAGWLAGRMEAAVDVLHVVTPAEQAEGRPVEPLAGEIGILAGERLRDEGASRVQIMARAGRFPETAADADADLIVLGKRGQTGEQNRRLLGSSVEPLIRMTETPICLASRVFLPVTRGLVLLDSDITHRTAVEFVATHPGLRSIDLDLAIIGDGEGEASAKLEWARAELDSLDARVFEISASGLTDALMQYMESRRADLFVVSREVLLPAPEARLRRIEEGGLWAWRTPVLVC